MNYEYGEPYLEISFTNGEKVRIKKSLITEIYHYIDSNRKDNVKVYVRRGNDNGEIVWYRFSGTMEEFDNHCKTIYI